MKEFATLYLDESGGKAWPPPWGQNPDRFYVLAGPVLKPDQDRRAHAEVPEILAEFFPDSLARPSELHYGDLINARGPYARLERTTRLALADRVWDLILQIKPTLVGSVVDKTLMKQRYADRAFPPNEYAMRATIERFDRDLEAERMLGMVIMDTESLESDRALRTLVHRARSDGIKLGGINYIPAADRKLENILNSVTFTPSEMSPGIQLADYIAYATYSAFERARSGRFDQVAHLWRRVGSYREPSVIPRPSKK